MRRRRLESVEAMGVKRPEDIPAPRRRMVRDSCLLSLGIMAISSTALIVTYRAAEGSLYANIQERLRDLAAVTALEMDGDLHERITRPEQAGSVAYRQATEPLLRLRRSVPDVFYAYTLRGPAKDLRFVLDSTYYIKNQGDDVSPLVIGKRYGEAPPSARSAARDGRVTVSSVPYTDRWGTFLSSFAPFRDGSGRTVGLVGVDLSMATLNQQLFPLRLSLALSLTGSALLSALAGVLHWRSLRSSAMALEVSLEARDLARRAAQDSEQANLAKTTFLATMGHELRTPLNGVIGLTDILLNTALTAHQESCLQTVRNSGESLLLLLNQLLDFSAIDSGALVIDAAPCRLRPLVEEVVHLFRQQAQSKGPAITLSFDADIPDVVTSDPLHLRQILVNLVGNAVRFTVQGEVAVAVGVEDLLPDGRWPLLFRIRDTGPGISPSSRETIFQPFTQGDGSSTRPHGGTGLGLAICHHLVVAMGGGIEVESEPGQGCLFTVSLPVMVPAGQAPAEASFAASHPLRILLAEDNRVNARVCELMLQRLGYGVSVACDGEEALEQQRSLDPDIILMDLRMPKLDGFDATRRIREQGGRGVRPWIVAVTANIRESDRAQALASGMDDFIGKPIRVESLQGALSRAYAAVQAR
ncbi:ATP-binding protein [Synechococcus sp. CCAP 1479/9]|uniref:ATP-binding protein n=1 Tax=Synechococcus sp. CCAP 1479/9 TaxID=1221593 RepID=UPI001C24429A|nr:ATP-binding protein [Synechococcus sp. CCAP 1479/9]